MNHSLSAEEQATVEEEVRLFAAVKQGLLLQRVPSHSAGPYRDIIELRDSLSDARMEDVPSILAEMERLVQLSRQQDEIQQIPIIDPKTPYFGHIRLQEPGRVRDLLIGDKNCISEHLPCPIIDWKNAPISRIFYRYQEGEDYYEEIGNKEVEGVILVRRTITFDQGELKCITTPAGIFMLGEQGWHKPSIELPQLQGGSGMATRPLSSQKYSGHRSQKYRLDAHLPQITALIDQAQFEIITQPHSGVILIQGGAGSGKTTVALHRLAYLVASQPHYFQPEKVVSIVFNKALANYISKFLPSLGIHNSTTGVYQEWAAHFRQRYFPQLPQRTSQKTPVNVILLKKHPFIMEWLKFEIKEQERLFVDALHGDIPASEIECVLQGWNALSNELLVPRILRFKQWCNGEESLSNGPHCNSIVVAPRVNHLMGDLFPGLEQHPSNLAVQIWEECFIQKERLENAVHRWAPETFSRGQIEEVWSWCVQCYQKRIPEEKSVEFDNQAGDLMYEDDPATLDEEDDTLLLLLYQMLNGPFRGKKQKVISYHHLMIDEVQDYGLPELQLLANMTPKSRRSITLAGDMDQQIMIGHRFESWETSLRYLDLEITKLDPLRIGYRSTYEIMELAKSVIGPTSVNIEWKAVRRGAPVEVFRFVTEGHLIGTLTDTLSNLVYREPNATVAVLCRHPAQAAVVYDGLRRSDIYGLRHITDQDFPFTPGIDVTDISQAKGLEFDYVILTDVDASTYGEDDRSRHFLYVGITRAAHQLWVMYQGQPSPLLPKDYLS